MSPSPRRGISKKTTVSGTGLHTGVRTEATFLPAPAGQGIVFKRVDLAGKPQIPALLSEVEAVERRTAIGKGESTIHTVEHLLAAVAAHEIDDLTVELTGPEPPILDGSVQPYFDALQHAGPTETGGEALVLTVRSEEHTSELQSLAYLVCRLLLEKKKKKLMCQSRIITTPARGALTL